MLFPHHQAILPYQLGILRFNSILILTGVHARSHRLRAQSYKNALPHLPFRCQLQVQVVAPASDPPTGSHDPLLSLINLLERLRELREIFTYVYQIITGYNSETTRWKTCMRQGMWEGGATLPECSPTQKLFEHCPLGFYGGFMT